MRKVFVIQLGFNNPTVIAKSMERFAKQTETTGLDITYWFYDALYPLPSPSKNRKDLEEACKYYGWEYRRLDKNEGQNGNLNTIFSSLKIHAKPEDLVAFWEPDSDVQQRDWLYACYKTTLDKSFHNIGFVTPHRRPEWVLNNQGQRLKIAGYNCRHLTWPGGWPMGIYTYGFIQDMQSLHMSHEYYGGTEGNILNALNNTNHVGLMFEDIEDRMNIDHFDPAYISWKAETIRLHKGSQLDFKDWLNQRGLIYGTRSATS
jgi:hypothetical protein